MPAVLPNDHRARLGGLLFLLSLLIFFLSSILLYAIYSKTRIDDSQSQVPLPLAFWVSTLCLISVSGMMHMATRTIRRERRLETCVWISASGITAAVFMAVQFYAMSIMLNGPAFHGGMSKGVVGMVFILSLLHALHVAGGVIALGMVAVRSLYGRYDHERHWPVDFAAQYWHFLDGVWLCMFAAFWWTTGG
jgi:cytochrome c oxidase subunit 3